METILHLLPLTGAQKAALQVITSESEHLFLPINNRGGANSIPQERRERTTILLDYVPPERLKTLPGLKWVQSQNAGVDPYLVPDALPEGARLTPAVGAYDPAVSEYMLAVLPAIYKRLPAYRDQQRAYIQADLGPVGSLADRTILTASAGDIGRHFARLIRTLGAQRVIGLRRSVGCPAEGFDEIYGLGALGSLLPRADVVALALPHTPGTTGLMGRAQLLAMRPGVVLLNAGRGSAVGCTALAEVLCSDRLLGAGLDVTDPGPLPPGHPPWEAPNLLLTPRTTGSYNHMEATLERIGAIFLDNLRRYMEGRTLRNQMR